MLRCPVCQGESIQESPAELAKEMRQVVREQLAAGKSSDEVKAYFVSKYGEWILLQPKARGVNLTVYVVPLVLLLGGAVLILMAARRWTRSTAETNPDSP
jgi:cytochrome c-type biogenesis protein CcmH